MAHATKAVRLSRTRARAKPARGFGRILVPLDFTNRDRATLKTALLVAGASRATTTLIHVVYVPDKVALRDLRDLYRELAEKGHRKLLRHAARFRRERLPVDVEVVAGIPLDEILEYARNDGTDLIVLSSHPVEPERPVPGWDTLSYKIAALCRCPVLLAK
jgi:nucleotide-binding universal stress UspA family protein